MEKYAAALLTTFFLFAGCSRIEKLEKKDAPQTPRPELPDFPLADCKSNEPELNTKIMALIKKECSSCHPSQSEPSLQTEKDIIENRVAAIDSMINDRMPLGLDPSKDGKAYFSDAQKKEFTRWLESFPKSKDGSNDEAGEKEAGEKEASPSPSYESDIAPLMATSCAFAGCHVAEVRARVPLETYEQVASFASESLKRMIGIKARIMPPRPRPKLSEDQINLFEAWIKAGTPKTTTSTGKKTGC